MNGESLGGGILPMAAMIGRAEFDVAPEISLGHYTHEKSPLGCTAGLAAIEFIEHENLLQKVQTESFWIESVLNDFKNRFELVGDVRGIGLIWAIELVNSRKTKEKAVIQAEKIMYDCLQKGLSFKVSQGNVITLTPALTIQKNELESALGILENVIAKYC